MGTHYERDLAGIRSLNSKTGGVAFSNPWIVLILSIMAALSSALPIILVFTGDFRDFLLYYLVPIVVPFIAFLFERAARWEGMSRGQKATDIPVLLLAMMRAILPVPLISGHALFLTYSTMTTRSWVARLTAFLVLVEVSYFKIFVWHDATVIGGLALGLIGGLFFRGTFRREAWLRGR